MKSKKELVSILKRIDHKGYKAYKELEGTYEFPEFQLVIDHVQGDPYADPSRFRVFVDQDRAGFPGDTFSNRSREIALRDFLTRAFAEAVRRLRPRVRGTGKSGLFLIDEPGQEILERSSCLVTKYYVELRFKVGLPAKGRTILGQVALEMLTDELPGLIGRSLFFKALNRDAIYKHIQTNEDQDALRAMLPTAKLIAFIANGSCLPRRTGIDDRPLPKGAVLFQTPPTLEHSFDLPNRGRITGMGISAGVTLIVGGGYHGKSTLMDGMQRSVYNHIPGDGRENCVTVSDAVKIRAEDGRNIEKVDISPFINDLPLGQDTQSFSSENSSGSTSQAANIVEMLEVGAKVLLIDEDTSATNFMIRDRRMQLLVTRDQEPITPLIDRISELHTQLGVSTVLVLGGSGDYFDVADVVIAMETYRPMEVTSRAKEITLRVKTERIPEHAGNFEPVKGRIPVAKSINARRGTREVKIDIRGTKEIIFGMQSIDLSAVEQLVDPSQLRTVAGALIYAREKHLDGKTDLKALLDRLENDFLEDGFDVLSDRNLGDYAHARRFEIAATLNRLRSLQVKMVP